MLNKRRPPLSLRNLSNTYYVNVLLQLWFHTIRVTVCGCALVENSMMDHLRGIFAWLHRSNDGDEDVTSVRLLDKLDIDYHVQHDLSEFLLLFQLFFELCWRRSRLSSISRRVRRRRAAATAQRRNKADKTKLRQKIRQQFGGGSVGKKQAAFSKTDEVKQWQQQR